MLHCVLTRLCVVAGVITSVSPSHGLLHSTSSYMVTITGQNLGSGNDITAVTFSAVGAVMNIVSQTNSSVVVMTTGATAAGVCNVTVASTSYGVTTALNAFTFDVGAFPLIVNSDILCVVHVLLFVCAAVTINAVVPSSGPWFGNQTVTLSGVAFGNGSDITSVTLSSTRSISLFLFLSLLFVMISL